MSEQPEPKPGRRAVPPITLDHFTHALARQDARGRARYGTPLQTFNGRDAGNDAFDELVDLAQYLTQLRLEHASALCALWRIRDAVMHRSWTDAEIVDAADAVLIGRQPAEWERKP